MAIGDIVAAKYKLTQRIGEGGMGVVYEAVHVATGRRVAVKMLTSELVGVAGSHTDMSKSSRSRRDDLLARFEREARSTGAIESENVVQVFDAGTDDRSGRPYMAMELLAGEDLQKLSKRLGPLPPELVLRVVAQACRGLGKAHDAGIVHRDVKMGNVFLARREDGSVIVKVLDFGIAKIKLDQFHSGHDQGLTQTGTMLGSPHYMSPEQAQGLKTIDHRTDLWSLGVVLYWGLAQRSPFAGESVGQLILAICSKAPDPVQSVAPWVPPGVASIVHRALQRDPAARFSSAAEMLAAISAELPDGCELHEGMLAPLSEDQRSRVAERSTPGSEAPTFPTPPSAELSLLMRDAQPASTYTGVSTSNRTKHRSIPISAPLIGVAAVAALGILGYAQLAPRAPAAPVAHAPNPPPVAEPQAVTERSVRVAISPADAVVDVDGRRFVAHGGVVELTGALGSTHAVRLEAAGRSRSFEVVIAADGAVPAAVTLDEAPVPAPPGAQEPPAIARASKTTVVTRPREPAAARSSAAPTAAVPAEPRKPQGVVATDSFE